MAKKFNKESLKNTMKMMWHEKYGMRVIDVGNNLFLFIFNNDEDRLKVLKSRPWLLDKHILILEKIEEETHPLSLSLFKASIWVRVYGAQFLCLSDRVGRIIGKFISDL
ncbi:DUF4283 domain-containing protein [Cephalotus follicularis]|uniref:DUF4283 domain-containing protein n=1 Tax=Cephalotus follicularis TaxID=3775 RepID=A0A1Q3BJK3_CEPFO|nr:DUF4283 domain-containing protein [Cephalotus follicularis]